MRNLFLLLFASALLTSCRKPEEDLPSDKKPVENIGMIVPTIFAGSDGAGSVDGTGRSAKFYQIIKITADNSGNLYVLESSKPGGQIFKIRKITSAGVTSTLFNGEDPVSQKGRSYKVLDIAASTDGNVYAVASMTNSSITYRTDNVQKYYQEYGTYKLSGDSLTRVSVSSTIAVISGNSWVAAHNLITNVAVDASGAIYGAIGPRTVAGVTSGSKVYQLTPNPKLIEGGTDGIVPATVTGAAAGNVYASTNTNVLKITTSGVSSVFTFPTLKTSVQPKLVGSQSGSLFVYGDIFDAAKEFKGTGFYKLKTDGTVQISGYLSNPPNVATATINTSGTIYYAVEVTGGGYVIYKTMFDQ